MLRSLLIALNAACISISLILAGCGDPPNGRPDINGKPDSTNQEPKNPGEGKKTTTPNASTSKPKAKSAQVSLVYSDKYLIDLGGLEKAHPFDIRKYEKIYKQLLEDKLVEKDSAHEPDPLTRKDILLIHDPSYIDKLKKRRQLAKYLESELLLAYPFSLDHAILKPFRKASGGTILAAELAMKNGIGINIGGGYHHAKPDRGEGFCIYADVPIAIRRLQNSNQINRALIIDVDAHQGNGTAVCLADDDSTFTFSIHQGDIYPIPKENSDWDIEVAAGTGDEEFLKILGDNLDELFEKSKPDICFIIGGCDTLNNDPLTSLAMTHDGIVKRDQMLVEACVKREVPVVLTLAGGYSPNAWEAQYKSIRNLINQYKLADREKKEK